MRIVLLSFSIFFVALAFSVFGHHMLTIAQPIAALVATASGGVAGVFLSLGTARVLKKDRRLFPLIFAGLFHVLAAVVFFGALQSPVYSTALKAVSVAAGIVLPLCGCIPLLTRENA